MSKTMIYLEDLKDSLRDDPEIPGRVFARVLNHLDNAPKIKAKAHWIPVTERLPIFTSERRRSVLVTLEDRQGKRLVTTAKYNPEFEEWYEFKDSRYYDFKVLAWMPKPERYEGA